MDFLRHGLTVILRRKKIKIIQSLNLDMKKPLLILLVIYSALYAFMALWGEVIGDLRCCTYAFGTTYDVPYVVLPFDIGLYNMSNGDFLIGGLLLSQTLLQTFLWSLIIISSIWLLFKDKIKSYF